jgi:isopentenyl phosphate kinase
MNSTSNAETNSLIFLKLGGSLITDKHSPRTPRQAIIDRIVEEIAIALKNNPDLRILLGHGSGSFGHTSGKKHGTRNGVKTKDEWIGFAEVWHDAARLNQIVLEALIQAEIPSIVFPPSSAITTKDQTIITWDISPIKKAIDSKLLPVVFGDVVFDKSIGGTILSTEDLFVHLAAELAPNRILLAGIDPGVCEDYPDCNSVIPRITPADLPGLEGKLSDSDAPDVTGGMEAKVKQMLQLVEKNPTLEILIFSGEEPGVTAAAISGESPGTILHGL